MRGRALPPGASPVPRITGEGSCGHHWKLGAPARPVSCGVCGGMVDEARPGRHRHRGEVR